MSMRVTAAVCATWLLAAWGPCWPGQTSPSFQINREFFFRECAELAEYQMVGPGIAPAVRGRFRLRGSMRPGIEAIISSWERLGDTELRRLAYILATARRESSGTFRPIREVPSCGEDEACRETAIGRLLEKRAAEKGRAPRANYALPDAEGRRYYGRGFVQVTFKENYVATGKRLSLDLVRDPDRILEPVIAADILVKAMLNGWYGNRKPLSSYIDADNADYVGARYNINPRSPNKEVTAAYATDMLKCLRAKQ